MAIEYHWEAFLSGKRVKYHSSHSSSCMLEIKEDLTSLWVHVLVYSYLQTLYLVYCVEFDLFILSCCVIRHLFSLLEPAMTPQT